MKMLFLSLPVLRAGDKLHIHVNRIYEIIYYTELDVKGGEKRIIHICKKVLDTVFLWHKKCSQVNLENHAVESK